MQNYKEHEKSKNMITKRTVILQQPKAQIFAIYLAGKKKKRELLWIF